jgi:integrase
MVGIPTSLPSPRPTENCCDPTTGADTRNKALKKTHLAPLTIHDLRHTYASLARKSGADLRYVQKTMGHSTPTVTANIYSDLYADELDQVATNLDRLHATETQPPKTGQRPDESN